MLLPDRFTLHSTAPLSAASPGQPIPLPEKPYRVQPGSAWGVFTIACTIPIALFVGFYMYRLRPGRVIEASLIGGALTLAATVAGGWVSRQPWGSAFNLGENSVIAAMAIYGFFAAVLPVWVLLTPRDYLSSFLKIGTILLLVGGTIIANPRLEAPAINHVFLHGGPTVSRSIFPFLFITIMCGAISGFHALVSSGTTPKMIGKESRGPRHRLRRNAHRRTRRRRCDDRRRDAAGRRLLRDEYRARPGAPLSQPDQRYRRREHRSSPALRRENPGVASRPNRRRASRSRSVWLTSSTAPPPASGAAAQDSLRSMWKYWYHFAIMFEALFILTTIDAGTRIGRFLLQEVGGRIHPSLGRTDWWPGAIVSTALIVAGWTYFISANSMGAIWPMFGVANQMLAVIALAIVSVCIANAGRARYLWVSAGPMLVVATTTGTASAEMLAGLTDGLLNQMHLPPAARNATLIFNASVQTALILIILGCGIIIVASAAWRIWRVLAATDRSTSAVPMLATEPA